MQQGQIIFKSQGGCFCFGYKLFKIIGDQYRKPPPAIINTHNQVPVLIFFNFGPWRIVEQLLLCFVILSEKQKKWNLKYRGQIDHQALQDFQLCLTQGKSTKNPGRFIFLIYFMARLCFSLLLFSSQIFKTLAQLDRNALPCRGQRVWARKSPPEKNKIYILFKVQSSSMRPYRREKEEETQPLTLGYYPFRGKVQICRLLCEYLHVPYVDQLFTPDQWNKYKEGEAKDWIIKELPFCKDGSFIVTGPSAMIHYVVERANRRDLFGRNIADQIKIDSIRSKHDIRDAILGLICQARTSLSPEEQKNLAFYWCSKIQPILLDYENDCSEAGWYYGYITVMDFVIYQLLNLIETIFPLELRKFKKLMGLRFRFSSLPEINNYQSSSRAQREYCPVRYFNKFKEERKKVKRPIEDRSSSTDMEVE